MVLLAHAPPLGDAGFHRVRDVERTIRSAAARRPARVRVRRPGHCKPQPRAGFRIPLARPGAAAYLSPALRVARPRIRKHRVPMEHRPSIVQHPFAGPGEMRARCRAFDWAATPLGPVEGWPPTLRTTVELVLASGLPNVVLWGRELIQIYN